MPDLMAEMAKHGAIRLVHVGAHLLARRIIHLCRANGDQALVVAGHGGNDRTVRCDFVDQKVED